MAESKDNGSDNSLEDEKHDPDYLKGLSSNFKIELEKLKKDPLYSKCWKELYKRRYFDCGSVDGSNTQQIFVHIMQFNILADGLTGIHSDVKNKTELSKKKSFIATNPLSLEWRYRGFRILEEIERFNPDIICMEEVDQFNFLSFFLEPLGYKGLFKAKADSPCIKISKKEKIKLNADGVAMFYKHKYYDLVYHQKFGIDVEKINNPNLDIDITSIASVFQNKFKKHKKFLVSVAHLKSTKSSKGESTRLKQLQHLLPELKKISETNNNIPIFIGLDLNAPHINTKGFEPFAYNSICNPLSVCQELEKQIENKKKNITNTTTPEIPNNYIKGYGLDLHSGYFEAFYAGKNVKQEPKYTTWKVRSGGSDKHTIDFIFYEKHKNVSLSHVLTIPNEKDINKDSAIPGWEYPSDHFAIQCGFQF